MRGALLVVMLVVLVFCAFTLRARRSIALSIFAVALLGATMCWLVTVHPERFDVKTEALHFFLIATTLGFVSYLTGRLSELRSALKAQKAELAEALSRIERLATHDELTALPNRRHVADVLGSGLHHGCLALLDIDWFKKINDTHGHAAGDTVLRGFAEEGRQVLRARDILARWGGEEFLLYLPDTGVDSARVVLDRLRARIAGLHVGADDCRHGVTFSAGLIELQPHESIDDAVSRADELLYRAKSLGRNRTIAETAHSGALQVDAAR